MQVCSYADRVLMWRAGGGWVAYALVSLPPPHDPILDRHPCSLWTLPVRSSRALLCFRVHRQRQSGFATLDFRWNAFACGLCRRASRRGKGLPSMLSKGAGWYFRVYALVFRRKLSALLVPSHRGTGFDWGRLGHLPICLCPFPCLSPTTGSPRPAVASPVFSRGPQHSPVASSAVPDRSGSTALVSALSPDAVGSARSSQGQRCPAAARPPASSPSPPVPLRPPSNRHQRGPEAVRHAKRGGRGRGRMCPGRSHEGRREGLAINRTMAATLPNHSDILKTVLHVSTRRSPDTHCPRCPATRRSAPTHIVRDVQRAPLAPPPTAFQVRTRPLGTVRIPLDYLRCASSSGYHSHQC